jgi:hypothetical protein
MSAGMPCADTAFERIIMSANANSLLSWFDRLLLIVIVVLLVMNRFSAKNETPVIRHATNQLERPPQNADESEAPPHYVVTASQHTISFSPEGVTQSRVSRIAQALSHDSGWQDAPVRQAADMREHDGLYHIAFVLSQQIDEKSVLVSTDGNLLSLIASPIGKPNAKILKQFYIPCPADQVGPLKTTVSNGIVRVTIHLAQ